MTDRNDSNFQQKMVENLFRLDNHIRGAKENIEGAFGVLEDNMEDTVKDLEGEVTALGDNGVIELLCEVQNRLDLIITKARHNVHGAPR